MHASENGHADVVASPLQHNAMVDTKNYDGLQLRCMHQRMGMQMW